MAKRRKAAGRRQKSKSKKTPKRLEIKRLMLEAKASFKGRSRAKGRHSASSGKKKRK